MYELSGSILSPRTSCAWTRHANLKTKARGIPIFRFLGQDATKPHIYINPSITTRSSSKEDEDLSETYTEVMQQRMGAPLIYRHEDGMNYTRILDDLIVGSCLQTPEDVVALEQEGVTTVLCLQENSDMEYFSLDVDPIRARCLEGGLIDHVRHAIRDFDPFSLRRRLPEAVALIAQNEQVPGHGTTYVHCTAGLGRAPATALGYMWWMKGIPLDKAYEQLTTMRPCKPREEAIREAAIDMLYGKDPVHVSISLRRRDTSDRGDVRIAGIDVGWGQSVPMMPVMFGEIPMHMVRRHLPPGKYQFKFIWVCVLFSSTPYVSFVGVLTHSFCSSHTGWGLGYFH